MKGFGARLRELFGRAASDEELFEELADILLEADMGPAATDRLLEELRERVRRGRDRESLLAGLKGILAEGLRFGVPQLCPGQANLFLVLGVNGVGKTTTIAKLASWYLRRGSSVMLAAGDTFRAAAIDQLALWGERLEVPVVRQEPGADPGAVIFDAIASARARRADLVLADTAGRLHNKAHLMKELGKIDKIVRARLQPDGYRRVLVIDATTGQNAVRQAEVFRDAVGVDSVILAKYDSTAKGGAVVSLCRELGLSISFVGTGERLEDLEPFDGPSFAEALVR